jgi:non-canonical purine NTP pyrophosphatase (RdgB/HAM1 family)
LTEREIKRFVQSAVLVTGNPGKAEELRRICGIRLPHQALDLPEIQTLDLLTVLSAKSEEAYRRLGRPVIVDETGLELAGLNGFPGPLIKWLLQAIGAEGLGRLGASLGDDRIVAHCAVMYLDDERTVIGEGRTSGRLVSPPRGGNGFGWDPVFLPDGEDLTYAELGAARKDQIGHRGKAWRALVEEMGLEVLRS